MRQPVGPAKLNLSAIRCHQVAGGITGGILRCHYQTFPLKIFFNADRLRWLPRRPTGAFWVLPAISAPANAEPTHGRAALRSCPEHTSPFQWRKFAVSPGKHRSEALVFRRSRLF